MVPPTGDHSGELSEGLAEDPGFFRGRRFRLEGFFLALSFS
jgi:hypothetical protein